MVRSIPSAKRVHADSHDSMDQTDPEFSTKTEASSAGPEDELDLHNKGPKDEEGRDVLEEYRIALKKFMSFSLFGRVYENLLLVTAVFSGCQYIWSTYRDSMTANILSMFTDLEMVLAIVFTVDWTLCFFMADHKLMHFTK